MLSAFILGLALLVAVILGLRWYVSADVEALKKALKWAGLGLVMVVIAWLALSGKLLAAVVALPAALMWFLRLATGLRYAQMMSRLFGLGGAGRGWSNPNAAGGSSGQGSDVRTRFVFAHLDHATGHMTGEVLAGRFTGRRLEDMNIDEVQELLAEAGSDPDSVRVLESYLERRDPNWREHRRDPASSSPGMSRAEALRVLGLTEGATKDEIKAAHRRLMANIHPDHGGTDYLAQQINQAKDVLLGK